MAGLRGISTPRAGRGVREEREEREEGEVDRPEGLPFLEGSTESTNNGNTADIARLLKGVQEGFAEVVKGLTERGSKRSRGSARDRSRSRSESEGEANNDVAGLLGKYDLYDVDVLELPHVKTVDKHLSMAKKQVDRNRYPIVDGELSKQWVAAHDKDSEWVKPLDPANLTMAQFSSLWWRRALVQLTAQSHTHVETVTLGDIVNRWLVLSRIACEESVKAAVQYDSITWTEAVSRISMRDGKYQPSCLGKLQRDPLATVLRNKERAAAQPHQKRQRVEGGRGPPPMPPPVPFARGGRSRSPIQRSTGHAHASHNSRVHQSGVAAKREFWKRGGFLQKDPQRKR